MGTQRTVAERPSLDELLVPFRMKDAAPSAVRVPYPPVMAPRAIRGLLLEAGNILYDGDFVRTGLYTMNSGRGLVEVRFSGSNSFDLNAHTNLGSVDNQAAAFLKPDTHYSRHSTQKFAHSLFGTVGQGLAKVELSSYSGTIRILKRN